MDRGAGITLLPKSSLPVEIGMESSSQKVLPNAGEGLSGRDENFRMGPAAITGVVIADKKSGPADG
jgi:hypothetical protein